MLLPDKVKKRSRFRCLFQRDREKRTRDNRKVVSYLKFPDGRDRKLPLFGDQSQIWTLSTLRLRDLTVMLTSPGGGRNLIQNGSDEGEDLNIAEMLPRRKRWEIRTESGRSPTTDAQEGNSGTLVDWSLTFP